MDQFSLGDPDTCLHLEGSGIAPPVMGCAYTPGSGAADETTDRLELHLEGAESELRAVAEALERIFERARRFWQRSFTQPQVLAARSLPADPIWQSPLLDGWLEWSPPGALARTLGAGRLTVHLRRKNYFERQSAEQVLFSNQNAPTGAASLTLANCNDGAGAVPNQRCNYAAIAAGHILGDLPAPAWLTLSNRTNDSDLIQRAWLGLVQNPYNPAQFTLEAESASGGTPQTDSTCSAGYKAACTLSADAETDLLAWTVSGTAAALCAGRVFHLLARFASTGSLSNVRFRLKVYSGSAVVWAGEQFCLPNPTDLIHSLGLVRLPPDPAWDDQFVLVLSGQRTTAATETITLDFLQLFGTDSFVQLEGLSALAYLDSVSFGGSPERVVRYHYATGSHRTDWYAPGSRAVCLIPGAAQLLTVLVQTSTPGVAEIDRQVQLSALYYPRRRAL